MLFIFSTPECIRNQWQLKSCFPALVSVPFSHNGLLFKP